MNTIARLMLQQLLGAGQQRRALPRAGRIGEPLSRRSHSGHVRVIGWCLLVGAEVRMGVVRHSGLLRHEAPPGDRIEDHDDRALEVKKARAQQVRRQPDRPDARDARDAPRQHAEKGTRGKEGGYRPEGPLPGYGIFPVSPRASPSEAARGRAQGLLSARGQLPPWGGTGGGAALASAVGSLPTTPA